MVRTAITSLDDERLVELSRVTPIANKGILVTLLLFECHVTDTDVMLTSLSQFAEKHIHEKARVSSLRFQFIWIPTECTIGNKSQNFELK